MKIGDALGIKTEGIERKTAVVSCIGARGLKQKKPQNFSTNLRH
jgi:hypothetical protein